MDQGEAGSREHVSDELRLCLSLFCHALRSQVLAALQATFEHRSMRAV